MLKEKLFQLNVLGEADMKGLLPIDMLGGTGTKKAPFTKNASGGWYKKLHQLNMLGRASAKNLFSLKMLG